MAYTERYVTQAASGGDGTIGSPWTLAEAFAQAVAGDRVNIQSDDGYSISGLSISNSGVANGKICFRGYDSSIGDLDAQGANSDGSLNTTNFPVITTTAAIVPNNHSVLQNLNITGSFSGRIVDNSTGDFVTICSCKILHSGNLALATVARIDDDCIFINSEFECTGATHSTVLEIDARGVIINCRFIGNSSSANLLSLWGGYISGCTFWGGNIAINSENETGTLMILNSTIYNSAIAIGLADASQSYVPILVNVHYTDCATGINNQYSATADKNVLEINTRTRDNTTLRIGIAEECVHFGEVTTDTGGWATDYVDAPNGDLTLISTAAGIDTGLGM